jgi:hypothetical protein
MAEYQSENNIASLVTEQLLRDGRPLRRGRAHHRGVAGLDGARGRPATRRVVGALKFYKSDSLATTDDRAVLQIPNYSGTGRGWSSSSPASRSARRSSVDVEGAAAAVLP